MEIARTTGKHGTGPAMAADKRVSIIGAGACGPEAAETARRLGRLLAERGFTPACGGLSGVMEAADLAEHCPGGNT